MAARTVKATVILKVTVFSLASLVLLARGDTTVSPTTDAVTQEVPTTAAVEGTELDGDTDVEQKPHSCYVCSSVKDGDFCHDPIDEDKLSQLPIKECNTTLNENACYKVVATKGTVHKEKNATRVTTRICGSWDHGDSTWVLDSGGSTGSKTVRSYCTESLCNAGQTIWISVVTWLGAICILWVTMMS